MARTVVGIFDDVSKAREAQERLLQSGIAPSSIDLSSPSNTRTYERTDTTSHHSATGGTGTDVDRDQSTSYGGAQGDTHRRTGSSYYDSTNNSPTDFGSATSSYSGSNRRDIPVASVGSTHADPGRYLNEDGGSIFDRIGNFFRSLFDSDEDARRYSEAGRGRTIVTVHTNSWTEAERAADIMDECGAIDTDNQTSYNHATGDIGWNTNRASANSTTSTGGDREMNRRSRIFDRPVESQNRLNEDYDYDQDRKEDYNTPQAGNRNPLL